MSPTGFSPSPTIGNDRFKQVLRKDPNPSERNDCNVRALSFTSGISYETAFELLEQAGRRKNSGTKHSTALNAYKPFTKSFRWYYRFQERPNVAKFINLHREGKWIVRTHNHVFALIDGVIHDTFKIGVRSKVWAAWEIK